MFFDINEIQIQVGVLFNNENVSFSIPHLRKIIFKIYTQKTHKKIQTNRTTNETNKKKKRKTTIEKIWYLGHTDSEKIEILMSHIDKNNVFPR